MNDNAKNDNLALAALICGIVSIFILPIALGSAAVIFGFIARSRAEKGTRTYQNANLGILFGALGLLLWVFALLAAGYLGIDMGTLLGSGTAGSQSTASAF